MVEVGDTVNAKYRILRVIGDGGMGSVYEARHELLGINVALKFLHPEIAEQGSLKQRFMQEARVSAAIRNPHIVRILDVDSTEGTAFLVMELLEGEPLSASLKRVSRLPLATALHYMLQILDGVAAAHTLGIVHRDLKPDNVFITPQPGGPLVRILDFGIAKLRQSSDYKMMLTRPGAVMGTPEYMAPEQAYSADLADTRSDVYSLGVIMFEMLSGKTPVEGDNPQEIAEHILTGKVRRLDVECPDLAPGLVNVVHVAMSADPDNRWRDAAALRDALLPFVPMHAHPTDSALTGSRLTPFAAISRTPRIDGVMPVSDASNAEPNPTRTENPRKIAPREVKQPVAPSPHTAQSTAPPDFGPPPAALHFGSAKTASMPKANVRSVPAIQPRKPTASVVGVRVAAVIALLIGAGIGVQIYYAGISNPPEPPRPTRRANLAAVIPAPEIVNDTEEEDDLSEPETARPSVAEPPLSRPKPTTPMPIPSSAAQATAAPNWVTIPAIPLPPFPNGFVIPTSLPAGMPSFLPFPQTGQNP